MNFTRFREEISFFIFTSGWASANSEIPGIRHLSGKSRIRLPLGCVSCGTIDASDCSCGIDGLCSSIGVVVAMSCGATEIDWLTLGAGPTIGSRCIGCDNTINVDTLIRVL